MAFSKPFSNHLTTLRINNKYDSGYSYVVVHFTVELGTTSPDFDVESQKSLELKNWEMRN